MSKSSAPSVIRLRGVRHNNLKNFDLDLPLKRLIVITGLSGSGKSSLAFDTLFAEGQRRYIETFSPYARQFFDRMDKPQVDSIEGIPPAIAIEQRNSVKTTRSTVGTMTEICDYMKVLWPHLARLHCRRCGQPVRKDSPQSIWEAIWKGAGPKSTDKGTNEWLITFDLPLSEKLTVGESLSLVEKQGYQRLLLRGEALRIEDFKRVVAETRARIGWLTVIQDRVRAAQETRARFIEACEQAYHFGKGKLSVHAWGGERAVQGNEMKFSNRLHCAGCDLDYREPTAALFSFNHPVGACPTCRGFGRVISIDYQLAIPDRSKTLAQGVVKPWQSGMSAECQSDLMRMCRHFEIPTQVPFEKLPRKWQEFVINGEPDYGKDEEHQWPRAWYGIKGYFRWLESKAYKMHVRVLLSRYRAYTPCPDCQGQRFQPEALLYRIKASIAQQEAMEPGPGARAEQREASAQAGARGVPQNGAEHTLNLADFYSLPVRQAREVIEACAALFAGKKQDPLRLAAEEVRCRLAYLDEVGLGYLTLDRPTRSLSGGETERVNLTTCLGTRLVNSLFVLDEPSVGLHSRDTERLVRILEQLRDTGNTVVVVEHEASVMRAADQIVDLGPGHGATGGEVVFQGPGREIVNCERSLTGAYLGGHKRIPVPEPRPVIFAREQARARSAISNHLTDPEALMLNEATLPYSVPAAESTPFLKLENATRHNLRGLSVQIPLGRFVCVTGVSGSGKTTLVREVLLPAISERLKVVAPRQKASDRFGIEENGEDSDEEAPLNRDWARLEGAEQLGAVVLVDQSILSKTPRSNPAVYIGAFDEIREFFAQSEPAKQRGLNASAFSFNSSQGQCQRCRGAGFEKIEMQFLSDVFIRCPDCNGRRYREHILQIRVGKGGSGMSIADLLDSTVEEASRFLAQFPDSRPARGAAEALRYLEEVGLGYLKLGQPINTLSGGESQRLKLVRHLAESAQDWDLRRKDPRGGEGLWKPSLFLFDEPTTGLHFEDVRVLLEVFQRLVDQGHSVLVIEHNLDVIKCADWILDLGPDAGDQGGRLVVAGKPAEVAACPGSYTGQALKRLAEFSSRATSSAKPVKYRLKNLKTHAG